MPTDKWVGSHWDSEGRASIMLLHELPEEYDERQFLAQDIVTGRTFQMGIEGLFLMYDRRPGV